MAHTPWECRGDLSLHFSHGAGGADPALPTSLKHRQHSPGGSVTRGGGGVGRGCVARRWALGWRDKPLGLALEPWTRTP